AELVLVLGDSGPRLLLLLGVIVAGEFPDCGGEDRRQHRRVGGQERPQRRGIGAPPRAASPVGACMEALIGMPLAGVGWPMRSDSLKSLRAGAAVRSAMSLSIVSVSLTVRPGSPESLRKRSANPKACSVLVSAVFAVPSPLSPLR